MPTIALEPELYNRMKQAASEHNTNVDQIFNQAVRRYLSELDHFDTIKQTLEKAAASGSRKTFHKTIAAIDWTTALSDHFILAIDLALELGDTTLATELSNKGKQQFPDDPALQQAAYVLAPPSVKISNRPPIGGLTATMEWFEQHAVEYKGQWIAVKDGKLIGNASSRRDLIPVLDTHDSLIDVLVAQVP